MDICTRGERKTLYWSYEDPTLGTRFWGSMILVFLSPYEKEFDSHCSASCGKFIKIKDALRDAGRHNHKGHFSRARGILIYHSLMKSLCRIC